MKRTPMKRKRSTPRRRTAPTFQRNDWDEATMTLWARSRGNCEHCGRPLNGRMERHHRQRRRDGGDRLSNLLAVLPDCHGEIHAHPALSRERGWIVSAYVADPRAIPVSQWGEQQVVFDDKGNAFTVH
jgi:hypothetical protein